MGKCELFVFGIRLWLCLLPALRGETSDTSDIDAQVQIYFGVGCFWHVQHEFVKAEKEILGRDDASYTAFAGYAGAKDQTAPACYYDGQVTAEVVGLTIPPSSVEQFADVYFKMFNDHDRSHSGDKGPHYRTVLGLPGGLDSQLMTDIRKAEAANGKSFDWQVGKGDDADTLYTKTIWVYDSANFPFHQAEIYHQFHDDYLPGGNYETSYNILMAKLACDERLVPTMCSKDDKSVLDSMNCANFAANENEPQRHGGSGGSGSLDAVSNTEDSSDIKPAGPASANSGITQKASALLLTACLARLMSC